MIACNNKKKEEKSTEQITTAAAGPAKDSAEIRTVITSFYTWYNTNYTKLMKYDLYSGIKKKDKPPYKINWDEVEKYQQFIQDSIPQLGAAFLASQKHFFEQCDSAFKKDVGDGPPYGFDYDWYTNSQEDVQYTLDEVNKNNWIISQSGENARVQVGGSKESNDTGLIIYMKKENDKWTIAKIGDNQ